VSGPEIMDKFVGSSEMKLREIFDKPPDIYESFRTQEADNGDAIAKAVRINPNEVLGPRRASQNLTRLPPIPLHFKGSSRS
jgi:SpoVK/Ycf46/Vps4 family AAA+-type ATPase